VVEVSGYTGSWYGSNCVLQITITTHEGNVYGPFGTMEDSVNRIQQPVGTAKINHPFINDG
jgi:hypothetical protein